jgi:hypothetical protein
MACDLVAHSDSGTSRLFEIALAFVRFDHVARFIVDPGAPDERSSLKSLMSRPN